LSRTSISRERDREREREKEREWERRKEAEVLREKERARDAERDRSRKDPRDRDERERCTTLPMHATSMPALLCISPCAISPSPSLLPAVVICAYSPTACLANAVLLSAGDERQDGPPIERSPNLQFAPIRLGVCRGSERGRDERGARPDDREREDRSRRGRPSDERSERPHHPSERWCSLTRPMVIRFL